MTASATRPGFKNPIIRWIDHRLPVFSYMDHELNEYPTPKNLNYCGISARSPASCWWR